MLFSLTTTHEPATDLGYLLGKNPARYQTAELNFGRAHVYYPQADERCCTMALMLDIDPVALVRRDDSGAGPMAQYVNDRPYAASSFLAVALAQLFSSAMSGRSRERPELAAQPLPLSIEIPLLRSATGQRIHDCFEPLGFEVQTQRIALDPQFPDWGDSPYYSVRLQTQARLSEVLSQLYLLLPAIDGDKHYFVGSDEVDKLVARGGDWLRDHPLRDWILSAYLKRRRSLVNEALAKLLGGEIDEVESATQPEGQEEAALEKPLSLNERRMAAIESQLVALAAQSVVDVGCGEGRLLGRLMKKAQFQRLLGVDVSSVALQRAAQRLHMEEMSDRQRQRIALTTGSLSYRDKRLCGFDAACAIEVIEHIDPPRLGAFERVLLSSPAPRRY